MVQLFLLQPEDHGQEFRKNYVSFRDGLCTDCEWGKDYRDENRKGTGRTSVIKRSSKKAIAIGRKYDTLLEVYFDGQGYAQKDEIAQVRKYHKNPNMWDYFLRTRIAVDRLEDLLDEKRRES